VTHLGSRECIATTTAHAEFFQEYSGEALVVNSLRKAKYRLAYSLSVDARQETDKLLLAFPGVKT
jgi:hypothetical protein